MPHSGLFIDKRRVEGTLVLRGRGYVDLSSRLKVSTALNEAVADGGGPVVMDLCDVGFVDSSGLGILMNASRRLTRQRRELRVVCPAGTVRRVFELTGLDATLKLFDSLEDAL